MKLNIEAKTKTKTKINSETKITLIGCRQQLAHPADRTFFPARRGNPRGVGGGDSSRPVNFVLGRSRILSLPLARGASEPAEFDFPPGDT